MQVILRRTRRIICNEELDKGVGGCVQGSISLPNGYTCYTIERPWLDNKPLISCIPEGEYEVAPFESTKFEKDNPVYQILDVPNRTYILIHVANWAYQLQGCIAVGDKQTVIHGIDAVSNSRNTFSTLKEELVKCGLADGFTLSIENNYFNQESL